MEINDRELIEPLTFEKFLSLEEENLSKSLNALGGNLDLPKELINIYFESIEVLNKTGIEENKMVSLMLFIVSLRCYALSLVTFLRGHSTESRIYVRKGIENIAYAYHLKDNSKVQINKREIDKLATEKILLNHLFLKRKEFPKTYSDHFNNITQILEKNDQLKYFCDEYRLSSNMAMHSNIEAFIGRYKKLDDNSFETPYMGDYLSDQDRNLVFLTIIDCFYNIYKVFSKIFYDRLSTDLSWSERNTKFHQSFGQWFDSYKEAVGKQK